MARTSIAAGASVTVTVPAGSRVEILGSGTYEPRASTASARPTVVQDIASSGSWVDASPTDGSVVIVAGASGASYEVSGPADVADPSGNVAFTAAQTAAVAAMLTGSGPLVPGQALILKAFTGRSQLTGGSPATKTALMEVPIPDGSFSDLSVRMDIEASFNWTNNANTKEWGIAIGASSATGGTVSTSVDLRTLSNTATASIADKIVVQRSAETPTRLYLVLPNNSRIFGVNATAGATVGVLASASIDPTATGRSLWVWGRLANVADQVSLEHLFVQLQRGAA